MVQVHAARRERAQQKIAEAGADAALITAGPNVRYLTGLASSNAALLLPVSGTGVLATDSRYTLAAQRACPDLQLITERFIEPRLAAEMVSRGFRTVAFESHEMSVDRHAELAAGAEGVTTVPFGRKIEELRTVKDPSELELLATACRISCQAIADVFALIRPGLTERQLAAALDRRMVDLGAERPAFDTIVASGPNGALPHHAPADRPMRRGDLITMDFGALYGGYHADMTRTVALGEPAGWQREIYELVATAQRSGIEAARPGADVGDVDAAARDLIRDAGHGEHFGHGLGHGVGLEVHEAPTIGYSRTGKLTDRVPVTVEPGVYLPGRGGVRIEDVLVVGADGRDGAGLLTTTTRELLVLLRVTWRRNVATTNDLKNGMTLNLDGGLWTVVEFQHVKPGKGGAFVRTKLKNITSGKVVDRTFNAGVKVDVATVDRREMQYLYREGADFVFMDTEDYDQPRIPASVVGDAANYLLEEQTVTVAFNDGTPLYLDLPAAVELTISQTDPGVQGDRSTGGTKPATLETGATIQVPLFISTGEKIKVDTRTGQYLGRA
jgi:translation elongation factor P